MDLDTSRTPVGIDLAKDSIAVAVGDGDTEVVRAFPLSREGLADLIRFLEPYGPFPDAFVFGLEASGPYTEPLLSWLLQRNARVLQLNPLLISRFRRAQSLRRTKTDAIDARTILHFIAQLAPASMQPCELGDDLQTLAAEYEQITQQVARLKTQIRQQVHALFPELASSSSLFSQRILGLLLAFPSAHAIAKATPAQLEAACTDLPSGRRSRITAQSLYDSACASIGFSTRQREAVLQSKIRQLQHLVQESSIIRNALIRAVRAAHPTTWRLLLSIPGVGQISAALFLAQVRSLSRFPSHRQLSAFIGFDPTTYESGQFKGQGHISKRGSPHLRRTLYLMAQSVARYSNTFRLYMAQLRDRGKAYRVAVIACANKLLRVIMALNRSLTLFVDTPLQEVSHS
ncbi:MAG: IS110 family transposase [Anaerolineales bacterium]|nr:IS110 family transposase [Anaerolineales bacterium]